jgi:hypothetical protein
VEFKHQIYKHLVSLPGWKTDRHILVLESDDWGSIRMPSEKVYDILQKPLSIQPDDIYNKVDSLETSDDLVALYDVLRSFKDFNGRCPVITAIAVVANPDFDKIRQSGYNEYSFETITRTFDRYPACHDSFALWKEGIKNSLFMPQFHGREHLNVRAWMKALYNDHAKTRLAFDHQMWGFSTQADPAINLEFQAAFDMRDRSDLESQKEIIPSGLALFEELFGYKAMYFVPPNGPLSSILEPICHNGGIRYLSTSTLSKEPKGNGRSRYKISWLGKENRSKLICLVRNCFFEPCHEGKNWINSCLDDVSYAFSWHKPAIVSMHRANFSGSINEKNRKNSLQQLKFLLNEILHRWPDTEFMTSEELGKLISISKMNG